MRTTRIEVSSDRGVFMISVAAELAEMHPQTLRMYEARGLIEPKRSPKGTRLYSQQDVDRLRRIQEMTAELGMNLAGVERVFELEEKLDGDDPQGRRSGAPRAASWPPRWSAWRACAGSCGPRSCPTCAAARSSATPTCSASISAGPALRLSVLRSRADRRVPERGYATIRAGERGTPRTPNRESRRGHASLGWEARARIALLVVLILAMAAQAAAASGAGRDGCPRSASRRPGPRSGCR